MTLASTMTSYEESVTWLEDLSRLPVLPAPKVGLRRVGFLLDEIGNPHRTFRSVHVAGTCGKGSTTSLVGSVLERSGQTTGVFRSPHLHSYRERIVVDGAEISPREWVERFAQIQPIVERMIEGRGRPGDEELGRPTLFDVLFTMCALHFADRGVQWAAIEAGLGGRLDPTNSLTSAVAVVTNVNLEHTAILGDTVEAIAREKAAIIKDGADAVTAATGPALSVIRKRAAEVSAPLLEVPRQVRAEPQTLSLDGMTLQLFSPSRQVTVELPLAGSFQVENAAVTFGAIEALRGRGLAIDDEAVRDGFSAVKVPGRLEVVQRAPPVILDGAHNPAAARELCKSLMEVAPDRRFALLFAAMSDKHVEAMAQALAPITATVIVTPVPGTSRSSAPSDLVRVFGAAGIVARAVDDLDEALEAANHEVSDGVVVCGSLYLVAAARERYVNTGVAP